MLQLTFNPGLTLTGFRTTRPRALTIVPKVEFNFEVIMYITIFSKKLLSAIYRQNLLESAVFATIEGRKTFLPERFVITFLHLLIYNALCIYRQLCWSSRRSRFATKPVIRSFLTIRGKLANLRSSMT